MKYVVLSFDDARKDFYTYALNVLRENNIINVTLNVITDFIGKSGLDDFDSANNECANFSDLMQCKEYGIEIASHSANHTNDIDQIIKGVIKLKELKLCDDKCGFSSPGSRVYKGNLSEYLRLYENNVLYLRGGNNVRRDGLIHAGLYLVSRITKSKLFFYLYNKRNIIKLEQPLCEKYIFPSITCNQDNSIDQVIEFIKRMPDNCAVIIMLHSIIPSNHPGWGKDKWYNSIEEFDKLCKYLTNNHIHTITNKQLYNVCSRS